MKKFICIVVVFVLLLSFSSCSCDHAWIAATCTEPKTCEKCGETVRNKAAHEAKIQPDDTELIIKLTAGSF